MAVVVRIDRDQWSGEGDFTEQLLSWLTEQPGIVSMRVEDASATRADVEYNFISNEIYISQRLNNSITFVMLNLKYGRFIRSAEYWG